MPPGRRILVVDDEPELCLLYRMALRDEGYEVGTAASGEQALEERDTWSASAHIVKSSDLSELTRAIRRLLDDTGEGRSIPQAA